MAAPCACAAGQGRCRGSRYLSFAFGSLGADAFREGLSGLGYVEGQNVLVEDLRAGRQSQLDDLAAELVASKVDIIVCGGSRQPVRRSRKQGRSQS